MNDKIKEKIISITNELKLPGIRKNFEEILTLSLKNNLNYENLLLELLEKELEIKLENRKKNRIRYANFPYKKYLEDLDVLSLPKDAQKKLTLLKSLDFLKNNHNLILSGNPGTGKTHIAIGLGIKACLENNKVLFTSVPSLVTKLKETQSNRTLQKFQNQFLKYDLIILDELGYISFDKKGAELLFTNLSLRAGLKSTIITTNLAFDKWNVLFSDTVLTAALLDRLTHKAYIINMNGNSYRLKETQEWLKKTEKSID